MNGIEELRHLLDEQGVKHYDEAEATLWIKDGLVYRANAEEGADDFINLRLWSITPAQAVEITLGRGVCRIVSGACSICGALVHESANMYWKYLDGGFVTVRHRPVNYCPNCGREVADE